MTNIISGDTANGNATALEYTAGKLGGAVVDKVLPGPNPDASKEIQAAFHVINETIKNKVEDKSKEVVKKVTDKQ